MIKLTLKVVIFAGLFAMLQACGGGSSDTSGDNTDTTAGEAAGGDSAGGDTAGGDTAGGDTAGGDTAGGDTGNTGNSSVKAPGMSVVFSVLLGS